MRLVTFCLVGMAILAVGLLATHATCTGRWTIAGNATQGSVDSPLVVCDQTEQDLGKVARGQEARASFWITNQGSRRLILSRQDQCCGSFEEDVVVSPGNTEKIELLLPTKHQQPGFHRESVYYQTNDPSRPTVALTVRFELTSE